MNTLYRLFYCLLSFNVWAADYPPAGVPMKLQQVSEHVFYVGGEAGMASDNEGFISNAAAIITTEGVVVVDTLGSPSLAALFVEKIREVTNQPIVKVIVTHYHADHIYGLQVFKELGAEIIAPAGYDDYLNAPTAEERLNERRVSLKPWVNDDTHLIVPDKVIRADETFELGGVVFDLTFLGQVHSDGDLTVLVKTDQVLISGDIIFKGRVPFTGGADTATWLALLEKLDNNQLKALIPGHGRQASDPDKAVKLTLDYLRDLRTAMQRGVDDMLEFDEAYDAADWSKYETLPAFKATHRRNANGVFLSLEQEGLNE